MSRFLLRFSPLFLFILTAFFLWRGLFLHPQELPSAEIGKTIQFTAVKQLQNSQKLFTPALMQGKITLLNVWASWCNACTEEQYFLNELAEQNWVIFGLNYRDNRKRALQWLANWGNPYQAIGADIEGNVAVDLGVYGAPETFIIDKKGVIRYRHVGVLNEKNWREEFLPLINKIKEEG